MTAKRLPNGLPRNWQSSTKIFDIIKNGGYFSYPPFFMSRSVSRVLLKTTIYLDLPLPAGSSHLLRTAGPAMRSPTVLLRIEFTASTCLHATSELLPHFSTLTGRQASRRYISVALVRGSPLAGVTRYPCPVEPGLSSRTDFRLVPAVVQPTHGPILIISAPQVNNISCNQAEKAI